MKISWNRLLALGIICFIYMCAVVNRQQFSLSNLTRYFYLMLFSVLFLLLPRRVLLFLIGGLIIWPFVQFIFFYFYNPFTESNHNLYVHPKRRYQVEYPAHWKTVPLGKDGIGITFVQKTGCSDNDHETWNYANNSIDISYYPDKESFRQNCDKYENKEVILMNNQSVGVFYDNTGVGDFGFASAALEIPLKSEANTEMFVLEVSREWNDKRVINPHAISPQRLLKKALPLLETFKPHRTKFHAIL